MLTLECMKLEEKSQKCGEIFHLEVKILEIEILLISTAMAKLDNVRHFLFDKINCKWSILTRAERRNN